MYQKLTIYQLHLRRLAAGCAALFAIAALVYGGLMLAAVERTAARAEAQERIQGLRVELAQLQADYLLTTQQLTPARAAELGFVPAPSAATLFADAAARTLSLRNAP